MKNWSHKDICMAITVIASLLAIIFDIIVLILSGH